jgi:hypothetical protein
LSPFVTTSGIEPILAAISSKCQLEVFTPWRPEEAAAGVSDPKDFSNLGRW